MADNAQLVRSILEAWNDRDFDAFSNAVAPDGTLTNVGSGQILRGPDGARQYATAWAEAFPDGRITINRVIAQDDCVVIEYTGRGTHTGTLSTPAGDLPATGRAVTLEFCDVTVLADGKITSQRSYFDSGSMMAQLGLAAGQPAAAAE